MHLLGKAMVAEAGGDIVKPNEQVIEEYSLGDCASTVYPIRGRLGDWAYAAGWDFGAEAAFDSCSP